MIDQQPTTKREEPSHHADLQLAREAVAGSAPARRRFVERMSCVPRILTARNTRLGQPFRNEDLEDMVQETLCSLWRRLDSFEGLSSLETWAYRFCHLELLNRLRHRKRRPPELEPREDHPVDPGPPTAFEYEHVYEALDEIGAAARILRLKHFDHLTFEEIGRFLDLSTNTAKTQYYRSLNRLRTILGPGQRQEGS